MQIQKTPSDKAATLLGFAIRAGKIVFGTESIERMRQRKHLIVVCETLSDNAIKKLVKCASGAPIVRTRTHRLEDILHRSGCKAIAVEDRQMAEAILRETEKDNKYERMTEVR